MKTKIVTFGEILLRISKPEYQRLFQGHRMLGNYGGSEANTAISLACMGDNVEYVTRLPHGAMGEAALMHYESLVLKSRMWCVVASALALIISRRLLPCATRTLSTTAKTRLCIRLRGE